MFINDFSYDQLRSGMIVLVNGQVREIAGYYLTDNGYRVTYANDTYSEHYDMKRD